MEAHHHHHHHQHQHQQKQENSIVDAKHALNDHPNNQDHQKSQQVTISPASPPSSSSSPSHEFSFTISLHTTTSSSSSKHHKNIFDNKLSKNNHSNTINTNSSSNNNNNNISTLSQSSPLAIDLSPADDIFFHGHLLPLHLLSHLPVSPRSSTNSLDSFTLPIKDLSPSEPPQNPSKHTPIIPHPTTSSSSSSSTTAKNITNNKPKSFSLFNLGRWKRGTYDQAQESTTKERQEQEQQKRKMRFDMSQVIKRYMRMVRPLLFFRGRRDRRNRIHFQRQPYSFSGILSSREGSGIIGRKRAGQYSAPASMRTSPSNSGLLVATASATATLPSAASDSTMEELQAAIQAAIAHCKNSIAAADRDNKLHSF